MLTEIKTDIVIVGAGISGLASAHFLKKQGLDVIILEKENRAGGCIRTEQKNGFLVEYGPNSTMDTSPVLHELFNNLGIDSQLVYANEHSKNRYIVRDKKLNALPMSPLAFIKTPHFSGKAKLRLLREPFISPANPEVDESLAQFVMRRLGQEFLDYAIDPFVAGVYAGVPEQLSVQSAFPKLYELEQKYGSLIKGTILGARERKKRGESSKQSAKLFSFQQGLQTMIDSLESEFREQMFLNTDINSISSENGEYKITITVVDKKYLMKSKNILTTIPVYNYSTLPGGFFDTLAPVFNKLKHPPVTMVYFGYERNPSGRPLDGFGFLIPRKEGFQILGTIWSSVIFSNRAPEGGTAFTTFVGGSRQPEIALLTEDNLIEVVRNDLKILLGIDKKPDLIVVQPWLKAIPQYNVGHKTIIDAVKDFESKNAGMYLSGNFRGGISVGDCIKQAKVMAERIKEKFSSSS